jgi:hypothetical protein
VAVEYHQEQVRREARLRAAAGGAAVVVDELRVKPAGLFWGDLQPSGEHWINACVAAYYGVGSVETPGPFVTEEPGV